MILFGIVGFAVELRTFEFIKKWTRLLTTWPGKALFYLFWGLLTFETDPVTFRVTFSIVILATAAVFTVGMCVAPKSVAICDSKEVRSGEELKRHIYIYVREGRNGYGELRRR